MTEIIDQGTVLLVEDDPTIQRLLRAQLTARGWMVRVASDQRQALTLLTEEEPDLLLLDIGLPDGDGLEICRRVREWSDLPILLVTAADSPQTKVAALEMGADDYLTKPFHTGELVARMRAVRRRARSGSGSGAARPLSQIEVGPYHIDFVRREARRAGEPIALTKIEFDLLRELTLHLDRVLTYAHLLRAVWGTGYTDVRLVHVHVSHLRRKLEPVVTGRRFLLTIAGVGYRFRGGEDET